MEILKILRSLNIFIWTLSVQLKMLSVQLKMLSEEEFKRLITGCTYEEKVFAILLRYYA